MPSKFIKLNSDILLVYDRLRRSLFLQSVAILASGTALARAIPILSSPILTRLYTPADFGIFAVFMALVSSIIPAVCGKYEVAMVLPKSHIQGLHLLGISFKVAIAISLIFLFVVVMFQDYLLTLLDAQKLGRWIYLAPLALVFTGLMTAMNYFANRNKDYKNMAEGKMVNSLSVAVTSIILGIFGVGFWGLLTGAIVGLIVATTYLLYLYRANLSSELLLWGRANVELMKRYIDYPLYNASGGLLNGITVALPVFFLSHYFPESIVGYFSLVLRVANTPLSFISASVSEVNLKKIVDLVNMKTDVRPYLIKVTIGLTAIVLLPTIILTIFSPKIFSFVFGEEWREAGIYMQILMPAMAVRFVSSTLSTTLGATQNNQLGAIWKVTGFVVTIVVFALFAPQCDVITLLKAFVVMDITLYLFYYLLIWKAAANPRNRIA
jgi:O-antigen/teichoic acid export membrane protein